jgi:hypothetical protein
MFYLENSFTVYLLDEDWMAVRQQKGVVNGKYYQNTNYNISFNHKKSNGTIGVVSYVMNEVGQARTLEIHADALATSIGGIKLSQRMTTVDGLDGVELVMSGDQMGKYIFLKKGRMGYLLAYTNTAAYFDQYLPVFESFLGTFKTL